MEPSLFSCRLAGLACFGLCLARFGLARFWFAVEPLECLVDEFGVQELVMVFHYRFYEVRARMVMGVNDCLLIIFLGHVLAVLRDFSDLDGVATNAISGNG